MPYQAFNKSKYILSSATRSTFIVNQFKTDKKFSLMQQDPPKYKFQDKYYYLTIGIFGEIYDEDENCVFDWRSIDNLCTAFVLLINQLIDFSEFNKIDGNKDCYITSPKLISSLIIKIKEMAAAMNPSNSFFPIDMKNRKIERVILHFQNDDLKIQIEFKHVQCNSDLHFKYKRSCFDDISKNPFNIEEQPGNSLLGKAIPL